MKSLLTLTLLLSACTAPQTQHYMHYRQTLLHGSDAALYVGCVRGVIRWHHARTGHWPEYRQVEELCVGVQKSFTDETEGKADGI